MTPVSLVAIQFRHDPPHHGGFSLRINADTALPSPEWQAGGGPADEAPADSAPPGSAPAGSAPAGSAPPGSPPARAAYAIDQIGTRPLTILATFRREGALPAHLEIRAVAPRPTPPAGQLEALAASLARSSADYLAHLVRLRRQWFAKKGGPHVLGDVTARPVLFGDGPDSEPLPFVLEGATLAARGVGVHDISWLWQWRSAPDGRWSTFATSRARIYVTLGLPTAPWQQAPFQSGNTQLPWAEVLEHACRWAEGARDTEAAARRVTAAVFGLGPQVIEYDCPGLALTHYTLMLPQEGFACSSFLARLAGDDFQSRYVNCVDCATIVSTFANVLGCDLAQSGMCSPRGVPFYVHPIRAIGSPTWRTPCDWGGFSYHEVAWQEPCDADSEVFDACLLVDADRAPERDPHRAHLPAGIAFRHYRPALVPALSWPDCEPQPQSTRRRRPVF